MMTAKQLDRLIAIPLPLVKDANGLTLSQGKLSGIIGRHLRGKL